MVATKTELLKTHQAELVKQHIEFDGQNRPALIYTASTDASDGTPCEVTEYVYVNPTSTQIKARKEGYATWDGTWDADFSISS